MPDDANEEATLFGYLTVVDDPAHGLCGGYLIVNQLGRPVEFHCTAPIHASRAQQILYGPTLRSSFFGEQIGPSLVSKAKSPVAVVLVNQPECVEMRCHTDQRVVFLAEKSGSNPSGRQRLLFPELLAELPLGSEEKDNEAEPLLNLLAESIDITEPFERIREAIYEAQRIGAEGQGADARAA